MTQRETRPATRPSRLRHLLYGLMLLASFLAPIADSINGTAYSDRFTVIDVVMILLYIVLTASWCTVDARNGGYRPPGGAARIFILLFAPVGLAIYLLQSRPSKKWAALVWLAFELGLVAATLLGGVVGDELYRPQ
jgi:apolipoprotein N-acyltransferase